MLSVKTTYDCSRLWAARRSLLLVMLGVACIPAFEIAVVLVDLNTTPQRNVPSWLHVSPTDTQWCTLHIQALVDMQILMLGAQAVLLALRHRVLRAVSVLAVLVWLTATTVFSVPTVELGTRSGYAPLNYYGSADPIPVSTDFNYRAYLPGLLTAVVTPAEAALAASLAFGIVVHGGARRRGDRDVPCTPVANAAERHS